MGDDLASFLASHPPFESLAPEALRRVTAATEVVRFGAGALILDAFAQRTAEVFVVVTGQVDLWESAEGAIRAPDESLGPGGVFGFSAMLTESSIGPRAVAATEVAVARIPGSAAAPAFTSRRGARFLAERGQTSRASSAATPTFSTVDELIAGKPLVVQPTTSVGDVARMMTEHGAAYAAVRQRAGVYGLITDAILRTKILVEGLPASTPAKRVMDSPVPTAVLGDTAAQALILMLDRGAEFVLVVDRAGELAGVIAARDFAVSPTSAGLTLNEQLRRAATIEALDDRARRMPSVLGDLLSHGLTSGKVISIYSSMIDTIVRRAIALIMEKHSELSVDAFTWLSLGSNGRREAVLSSDVDSAVAFDNNVSEGEIDRYRAAFAEVDGVLARAGLSSDGHGAAAQHRPFARTNRQWRAAGQQWLASPADNQGAIMTSLMVDGRPIHGDPGLPAVTRVFGDLRRHPGTMRLLLQESLSTRARLRSMREVLTRRTDLFDIKEHALVPVINIGRWAGLSVGSAALPTTERLRAASGSAMLPTDQANTLIEVFEVLQRLRLRYQLMQHSAGDRPSDLLSVDRLSPIDRSVIAQAVREISAIQRRMANVSTYIPPDEWTSREEERPVH